jgi:hypothetical protein
VFFLLIIGLVYIGLLMFTMGSMHYAVAAAATFVLNLGVTEISIPLSAKSCFP